MLRPATAARMLSGVVNDQGSPTVSSIFAQYRAAIRSFNRSLRHPRHQAFALAVVVVMVTGVQGVSGMIMAGAIGAALGALTTIGFGDLAPTTTFSRLFTVVYAIVGVGLIGTLLHLVVSNAQQAIKRPEPGSSR